MFECIVLQLNKRSLLFRRIQQIPNHTATINSISDDNPIAIIVQGGDGVFFFEILKTVINEYFFFTKNR